MATRNFHMLAVKTCSTHCKKARVQPLLINLYTSYICRHACRSHLHYVWGCCCSCCSVFSVLLLSSTVASGALCVPVPLPSSNLPPAFVQTCTAQYQTCGYALRNTEGHDCMSIMVGTKAGTSISIHMQAGAPLDESMLVHGGLTYVVEGSPARQKACPKLAPPPAGAPWRPPKQAAPGRISATRPGGPTGRATPPLMRSVPPG